MREKATIRIPTKRGQIKSLNWCGDELVDIAGGYARYRLDGTEESSRVNYAFRFDRAVTSRDGKYAVIYENLGTKGLVLREGEVIREINRSFYQAHVYEYPVVIFKLPDGREAIAHCPDDYNKIEIEDIETGERLTSRDGEAMDFFHSRLQSSPDGEYLLSAGWIWHPLDLVVLYRVRDALLKPETLDADVSANLEIPEELWEIHAATFQDANSILMTGSDGSENVRLLVRYSLRDKKVDLKIPLEEVAGTIMPLNDDFLIGFHEHPKLIQISTGKVVHRWPELNTGKQNSCIIRHLDKIPPLALDPERMRFAVADQEGITVIQLG